MTIPRLLTLGLLLTLLLPCHSSAQQSSEAFPAISGKTLAGGKFELTGLKGKPVLIKIGTTWCGACQQQSKEIEELSGFLKSNHIHFIDVYVQESAATVNQYLHDNGMSPPETVILDDGGIAKQLNVYLIPRVILLDKEHKIYRDGGIISSKNLKETLQAMLDNK